MVLLSYRRPIPERRRLVWFSSWSHNRQPSLSSERRRMHGSRRQRLACRPTLAALEDRRLLSTLTVTNNNDSGSGLLRDAIAAAVKGDTRTFPASTERPSISSEPTTNITVSL
jgi:hypothetical protein